MAHKIVDNQIAYVGEEPWHGLGTRVPDGASPLAMLKAARLDWEVTTVPLYMKRGRRSVALGGVAIMRADAGRCFGYASARYTPVQNRQTVEFFREFCDAGDLVLETVGAVGGGEYVWALARVQEKAIAIDNDVIEPYLLIANSHVPGRSLIVKNTQVRVVCNNTLTLALADGAQTYGRFVHTQSVHDKIARAKDYVGAALAYNRKFKADVHALVATRVSEALARALVGACFEIKPDGAKADRIVHLFQGGQIGAAELDTTNGNAWGLLNAATQHIDHEAGRSADARVKSAWFGHGEAVKRRLLGRLLQVSGS